MNVSPLQAAYQRPDAESFRQAGLTEAEAAMRLAADGPNELPHPPRRGWGAIALGVAREPMFQLLAAATAIYFALGDFAEAMLLAGSAVMMAAIASVQEFRAERALEALRDLTSPRALAIRSGERRRISGREVVRGDLIVLAEGDRVPADALLLTANDLELDESLLTGESIPVAKRAAAGSQSAVEPEDGSARVYAGAVVIRGQGLGRVFAIGAATEIGKVGKSLGEIAEEPSPLAMRTGRLVRLLAMIGIGLSVIAILLYGLTRGSWIQAALAGVTLAMSLLPEEFPLVLMIFLAMGARRIARANVLTRRSAAIESLGAATVLCTDKTGTLTLNRMALAALAIDGEIVRVVEGVALSAQYRELLEWGRLASESNPTDAMEQALAAAARLHPPVSGPLPTADTPVHEYGLSGELPAMTHAWPAGDDLYLVAVKGAPETVAALCRVAGHMRDEILASAERMAGEGMRVLGVARAEHRGRAWPATPHGFDFAFAGLIGFADPLRPSARDAVRECREAGIRVVMVTGDYPATARAIARQAGIDAATRVVTGAELAAMNDAELRAAAAETSVFARIRPEQKLSIVRALKANGEIVAMTGDGVNDAPALRAAHIGIAMGGRGADVAREAAALVLLDDDFSSIVKAIQLGRRINDNLRKAMGYLLAAHVPIAGLSLLPLFGEWPLALLPAHIAFLQLVIDPVSSIAFEAEPEEAGAMRRPPRAANAPLFSAGMAAWSICHGASVMIPAAAIYFGALLQGVSADAARAAAFAALVAGNLGLVLADRSSRGDLRAAFGRQNTPLWMIIAAASALLALTLLIAPVRRLFRFAPPSAGLLAAALIAPPVLAIGAASLKGFVAGLAMRRAARAQRAD
jgi:Ca2+-transporting ATPase